MVHVWRVENAAGQGPYTGASMWGWETHAHTAPRNPEPHEDARLCEEYAAWAEAGVYYLFGFESEAAAHRWFDDEELRRLASDGFSLRRVPARRVLLGTKQLIFIRANNC